MFKILACEKKKNVNNVNIGTGEFYSKKGYEIYLLLSSHPMLISVGYIFLTFHSFWFPKTLLLMSKFLK